MSDFGAPQSRNEAILQNMLGADNELGDPMSRIEDLLMQLREILQPLAELDKKTLLEVVENGRS